MKKLLIIYLLALLALGTTITYLIVSKDSPKKKYKSKPKKMLNKERKKATFQSIKKALGGI